MDLMQLCGVIKNRYDDATVLERPQEILVDVIGIGAGVVDRLREQNLPSARGECFRVSYHLKRTI
jgi:phage terminase large subunit